MHKADLYQRANGLQRRDADEILKEFSLKIRWNENGCDTLIDIGCGTGDVTVDFILPLLPNNFGKLVGADISEEMIKYARNKYRHPRVTFEIIDISVKRFEWEIREQYHHLTSFYCLHWVQNQRQALSNIIDLLLPGGDCLLVFLAKNPIFQIYEAMAKTSRWNRYMKDVSKYTSPYQHSKQPVKEFKQHLVDAGFSNIECEAREKVFVYHGLDIVEKSVKAVNPFAERIPKHLHEEYYQDYFKIVQKMSLIEQNNNNINESDIHVPYTLIVAYATKLASTGLNSS